MELLALKCVDGYLKLTDTGYRLVGMDKASVRPMAALDDLKAKKARWQSELPGLRIVKMTITETDL
jgi:hypothetical protein